ncbi:MAG: DNA mismatch repair endonuclease MutL [Chloroflexota bacterium]|nr:MAG: DNA mismatch repair endonuclease MutL [Chloroflexota bacterium]
MPIRVLATDVAAKIAAGEVIERPSSVVKELIENALDAGSTRIIVEIRGGGVQLIRVVDNGCGIAPDEASLAFQRHATSKLSDLADLQRISTLGFRGEALPSIAAVAEMTLATRRAEDEAGTLVRAAGEQVEQGHCASPLGTTVTVHNLFQSVPARLKFLKSTPTENNNVTLLVTHYALAYPDVRFSLHIEGRVAFQSTGNGSLRDALAKTYNTDVASKLLEIRYPGATETAEESRTSAGVEVEGFVSPPAIARATRTNLSFFLSTREGAEPSIWSGGRPCRRWIRSGMLSRAVTDACRSVLPEGKFPIAALTVSVPADTVDVNVHPAKWEVKFLREREVYGAVFGAVRQALGQLAPIPEMRARPFVPPAQGFSAGTQSSAFEMGGWTMNVPFGSESSLRASAPSAIPAPPIPVSLPILRVVGQLSNLWIVAEGPEGLYLIDQHTAHERVLYDRHKAAHQARKVEMQGLLEPLVLEMSTRQSEAIVDKLDELSQLGFHLEAFGENSYLLRAVPSLLHGSELSQTVSEVLESIVDQGSGQDWIHRFIASLACHGAIRAGQTLSLDEMRELVRQLEATAMPRTCPHGRPTMIMLSSAQLEREFGRQ